MTFEAQAAHDEYCRAIDARRDAANALDEADAVLTAALERVCALLRDEDVETMRAVTDKAIAHHSLALARYFAGLTTTVPT